MPDPNPKSSESKPKNMGLSRLWSATRYSIEGLRSAWLEPAFRQEFIVSLIAIPTSLLIGRSWMQVAMLLGSLVLLLIVELLNTGLEACIDRIGPERHELSKKAKDMGSAAVFLALIFAMCIWLTALLARIFSS